MEQSMNNQDATGLSPAALSAIAGITGLQDGDRAAALRTLGLTRGLRVWTPRDAGALPTLTGLVPARDREAIYGSAAWAGYRPTTTIVAYIVQARGLAQLSAEMGGVSLAKVGTAMAANVARRVADLGASDYGAWSRAVGRYDHVPGFEAFHPAPRLQLAAQPARSPVRLGTFGIEVGLPAGLTPGEFEASLNDGLLPLRLQTVADSPAGRALCDRTGVAQARLQRFYRAGSRFKAATELTLMRPQADVGALARLCADIVIDAVLGLRPKRPVR